MKSIPRLRIFTFISFIIFFFSLKNWLVGRAWKTLKFWSRWNLEYCSVAQRIMTCLLKAWKPAYLQSKHLAHAVSDRNKSPTLSWARRYLRCIFAKNSVVFSVSFQSFFGLIFPSYVLSLPFWNGNVCHMPLYIRIVYIFFYDLKGDHTKRYC